MPLDTTRNKIAFVGCTLTAEEVYHHKLNLEAVSDHVVEGQAFAANQSSNEALKKVKVPARPLNGTRT